MDYKALTRDYKAGDFAFVEFELCEIKEVSSEGRITLVSTGYFSHSSYDLSDRTFPLTLSNKILSEGVHIAYDKLHKEYSINLNFPDIHRVFIEIWVDLSNELQHLEDKSAFSGKN